MNVKTLYVHKLLILVQRVRDKSFNHYFDSFIIYRYGCFYFGKFTIFLFINIFFIKNNTNHYFFLIFYTTTTLVLINLENNKVINMIKYINNN